MDFDKTLLKQIGAAYKQAKLMHKQHGFNSQQYQDALKYHSDLVIKHMTGGEKK